MLEVTIAMSWKPCQENLLNRFIFSQAVSDNWNILVLTQPEVIFKPKFWLGVCYILDSFKMVECSMIFQFQNHEHTTKLNDFLKGFSRIHKNHLINGTWIEMSTDSPLIGVNTPRSDEDSNLNS